MPTQLTAYNSIFTLEKPAKLRTFRNGVKWLKTHFHCATVTIMYHIWYFQINTNTQDSLITLVLSRCCWLTSEVPAGGGFGQYLEARTRFATCAYRNLRLSQVAMAITVVTDASLLEGLTFYRTRNLIRKGYGDLTYGVYTCELTWHRLALETLPLPWTPQWGLQNSGGALTKLQTVTTSENTNRSLDKRQKWLGNSCRIGPAMVKRIHGLSSS